VTNATTQNQQHDTNIIQSANPLPREYFTNPGEFPGVGGRIKVRPEDFLVDEQPLYDPEGKGEHLYLGIEKTNVAHGELMATIRKQFGVTERAIGFAGMKDKMGVTRQAVSIHLLQDPPTVEINHSRIKVLWAARHRNKLRRGHLAGNRFSIRVRNVDPLKAPNVLRTLRFLEKYGVPNYFGSQRFGYRHNNHAVGASLIRGDWMGALTNLLGARDTSFPEYQRQRRELFEAGKYEAAAKLWTAADRSERIACTALSLGRKPREAIRKVGETAVGFWISALQSAVFNWVLDQRLRDGRMTELIDGDVAWRHATQGMFNITASELASGELAGRLEALEISPSGPLWGKGMMEAGGEVAIVERNALKLAGLTENELLKSSRAPEGGRRPLRTILKNAQIEGGIDDHGQYIRVAFDLPRGAYATIVMREIMKNDAAEQIDSVEE
jgi:tRNA pseudouridine13 synthase